MERIDKYSRFCRSWEGGWAKDPNNADKSQMYGLTYKSFCEYRKAKKLKAPSESDLRNITVTEWNEVMRWRVWNKIKADKIKDEFVAYLIADSVWMTGADYIKNIQELLKVEADGKIGPITLGKINDDKPETVFKKLWEQREAFLNELGQEESNKAYLNGWLNRLNSIKYGCLCNNGIPDTEEKIEKIEKYSEYCRSWEGGWSDNPNDKGGATMRGVTYKTFCRFRKAMKRPEPTLTELRKISNAEWTEVLRWGYWDPIKADEIKDEWVTYLLADCVWMSGTGYIKNVQRQLGLKDDGVIGKKTLAKLNGMNGEELFKTLWQQREKFLKNIAKGSQKGFLSGWLRRLNCMNYGFMCCNSGKRLC